MTDKSILKIGVVGTIVNAPIDLARFKKFFEPVGLELSLPIGAIF